MPVIKISLELCTAAFDELSCLYLDTLV